MTEILAEKNLQNGAKLFLEKQPLPPGAEKDFGYASEIVVRFQGNKSYRQSNKSTPACSNRYFRENDYRFFFEAVQDEAHFFNLCGALSKIKDCATAGRMREEGLGKLIHISPSYTPRQRWNHQH